MSDLSATNCGCGCESSSGFGGNSCLWIILLLCCCGGCGGNGRSGFGGGGCDCLWIILSALLLRRIRKRIQRQRLLLNPTDDGRRRGKTSRLLLIRSPFLVKCDHIVDRFLCWDHLFQVEHRSFFFVLLHIFIAERNGYEHQSRFWYGKSSSYLQR